MRCRSACEVGLGVDVDQHARVVDLDAVRRVARQQAARAFVAARVTSSEYSSAENRPDDRAGRGAVRRPPGAGQRIAPRPAAWPAGPAACRRAGSASPRRRVARRHPQAIEWPMPSGCGPVASGIGQHDDVARRDAAARDVGQRAVVTTTIGRRLAIAWRAWCPARWTRPAAAPACGEARESAIPRPAASTTTTGPDSHHLPCRRLDWCAAPHCS